VLFAHAVEGDVFGDRPSRIPKHQAQNVGIGSRKHVSGSKERCKIEELALQVSFEAMVIEGPKHSHLLGGCRVQEILFVQRNLFVDVLFANSNPQCQIGRHGIKNDTSYF